VEIAALSQESTELFHGYPSRNPPGNFLLKR